MSEPSERVPAAVRRPPGRVAIAALAEAVGTYILVFFGTGTVVAFLTPLGGEQPAPLDGLAVAFAFGLAVVLAIYAFGHVSGTHINPAVTLALATVRRFPWSAVPLYLAAQFAGAILASLTLWALFGDDARKEPLLLGATAPGERGSGIALLAEVVITFILVVVIMATATDARAPGPLAAGLAIGLTVAAGILVTLPISGGSFNPARTFGPMIVSTEFPGWWAYLIGPPAGGIVGALTYELLLRRGAPPGAGRAG